MGERLIDGSNLKNPFKGCVANTYLQNNTQYKARNYLMSLNAKEDVLPNF